MNSLRWVLVFVVLLFLVGCGDDDTSPDNPLEAGGNSTLTLRLIDAPGDLAHAWVEITRITLHGETDDDAESNVTLFEGGTGMIDLLTLVDTAFELIKERAVPPGTYNQLRLVIGAAVVETEDGEVFAIDGSVHPEGKAATGQLTCPSCAQSGLKVKLPGGAVELDGDAKVLVLDFDVSQSFGRQAGRSGRWVMRPNIQATDLAFSGSITGRVTLDDGVELPICGGQAATLELFTVRAFDDADAQRSGVTAADGSYGIGYVVPGRYGMLADAVVEFADEILTFSSRSTPTQVVVEAGGTATADFIVSSAVCSDRL